MFNAKDLNEFTLAMWEAAFFAECGPGNEECMDKYDLSDIDGDFVDAMEVHAASFVWQAWPFIEREDTQSYAQAGHDFYMTCNGHGVGFWETSDWPKSGAVLTELCKGYPSEWNLAVQLK